MRLRSIQIENFRSFENETIDLSGYSSLVGPNGAGKSTILVALNLFFRNTASSHTDLINLGEEDFHLRKTANPIRITLTFDSLTEEAKTDLKAYVRHDKLVVSAVAQWDAQAGTAEVTQKGVRSVMLEFVPFFEAQEKKARAAELREIYEKIRESVPDLPKGASVEQMRDALRSFEETHLELCKPFEAETQFYGWSKGDNLLRKHVQWVYIPAVKDASSEQEEGRATALGELLERTVRAKVSFGDEIDKLKKEVAERYQKLLENEQPALDNLSKSLSTRLQEWTHLDTRMQVKWHYNEKKSVAINDPLARLLAGERDFLGEIARLGHGLQRALLVSLLQELFDSGNEEKATLILGFEEPELYQHPPQARHMLSMLEGLASKNSQVIVTTHSAYFISGKGFENIRMVRCDAKKKATVVRGLTHSDLSQAISSALGDQPRSPSSMMASIESILQPTQNELFFTNIAVLVEGLEDLAFLTTYFHLMGYWSEFRRLGCHFVLADGKTNLSRPLAIANGLKIPTFTIFDGDAKDKGAANIRDNTCILRLCGIKTIDPLPSAPLFERNVVMWPETIGKTVVGEISEEKWTKVEEKIRKEHKFDGVSRKNSILTSTVMETLWQEGIKSASLLTACESIRAFARQ
jgi:putative ATP-dependent endonuclease of the OLD family